MKLATTKHQRDALRRMVDNHLKRTPNGRKSLKGQTLVLLVTLCDDLDEAVRTAQGHKQQAERAAKALMGKPRG